MTLSISQRCSRQRRGCGSAIATPFGAIILPALAREAPLIIYVDADACPVKEQIYRVAMRYGLPVRVVANSRLRVPSEGQVELVVVEGSFEVVDDWIAETAGPGDIVTTADVL